jgi:hypothetical protein
MTKEAKIFFIIGTLFIVIATIAESRYFGSKGKIEGLKNLTINNQAKLDNYLEQKDKELHAYKKRIRRIFLNHRHDGIGGPVK